MSKRMMFEQGNGGGTYTAIVEMDMYWPESLLIFPTRSAMGLTFPATIRRAPAELLLPILERGLA